MTRIKIATQCSLLCSPLLLGVLASSASAQFSAPIDLAPTNSLNRPVAARALDLDGDGYLDVLGATFDSLPFDVGHLICFRNTGAGSSGASQFRPGIVISADIISVRWADANDLDMDGDLDVVVTHSLDNELRWFENLGVDSSGDINFGPATSLTGSFNPPFDTPTRFKFIDLDDDGDDDLVVPFGSGGVAWLERTGPGSFGPPTGLATLMFAQNVDGFDADLDGDVDLFVASTQKPGVQYIENLGGGQFAPAVSVGVPLRVPIIFEIMDMDQDGDTDLVSATFDAEKDVVWVENNGGDVASWPVHLIDADYETPRAVAAGDIDRDGDIDVAVADRNGQRVAWNENLGGGQFAPSVTLATATSLGTTVELGDLDNDGFLDLTYSFLFGPLGWIEGEFIGEGYCSDGAINSTGLAGNLTSFGARSAADNSVTLRATQLPPNEVGFFMASMAQGASVDPANFKGTLCLGGSIGRFDQQTFLTGPSGQASLALDLLQMPSPSGATTVAPGSTWRFQALYTDGGTPGARALFSRAVQVTFN